MARIVVATGDEGLRQAVASSLNEAGWAVAFAASWAQALEGTCSASTGLVLLDPSLPGLEGRVPLLREMVASLPHQPVLLSLGRPLDGVEGVPSAGAALRSRVTHLMGPALSRDEARALKLLGLGPRPLPILAGVARVPLPVVLVGERGTGKKRVAEMIHLLGGTGPFVSVSPSETLALPEGSLGANTGGTVYLGLEEEWSLETVLATRERALRSRWRLVVGTRVPPPRLQEDWHVLTLRPLRERPDELRALTLHYIQAHCLQMRLPRRRLARGMWPLILGYPWPGNARELESFVVALLAAVDRASLHPRDLPPSVRALVDPRSITELPGEEVAFEEMVERRLRRFVALYEPGGEPSLYDRVRIAAERPLLRLVLARCGGNQKAAAQLLGISRNTLRAHLDEMGLSNA